MTCDDCFEAFSASVDGELSSAEHEAMDLHLDECADCQRLRARMLSLSAEMKGQPFPEPGKEAASAIVEAALSGVTSSGWGWLRPALRKPYESWPWRFGLRLSAFGGMTALVILSAIARWLLPPYGGVEAAAEKGLPDAAAWLAWGPTLSHALAWAPLLVLLVAAWTSGVPALLGDLWSESRLTHHQLGNLALGLAAAGPFAALPLLAGLELGAYVLVCCFWAALCLVTAFAVIAFKAARPLPRLALDFVTLALPLAALEWTARTALELPRAEDCQSAIALLVGSVPFATLAACLAMLATAVVLTGCGLMGAVPSYRGVGGRWAAALLVAAGLLGLGYGLAEIRPYQIMSTVRVELQTGRQAYLLLSDPDNRWLLPAVEYPRLEVNVADPGADPRAARLRLASAYLDWDEPRLLQTLQAWADHAPGVAWGLSSFVDSLGQRQGSVLTLPTEERQKLVAHLLTQLRWRVLAQAVLSRDRGSIAGRIEGIGGEKEGIRLRLFAVGDTGQTAHEELTSDAAWAARLVRQDNLDSEMSVSLQRTAVSGVDGRFVFTRVPPGRYGLAVLGEGAPILTFNSSIPDIFEVGQGEVRLAPIKLTAGSQGTDLSLDASNWRAEGPVRLSVDASGPHAIIEAGGAMSMVVKSGTFSSGKARIKVLVEEDGWGQGALKATLLSKEGRTQKEVERALGGSAGMQEMEIDSGDRDGYLQLALFTSQGRLRVRAVRLEVLP